MASVYRKQFTKPLPEEVEITVRKGKRYARWKNREGKTETAPLTKDGLRIVLIASTWTAKFRDGTGILREFSTGCKDQTAARAVLNELIRRVELVKGGIVTAAEDSISDHQQTPTAKHVEDYLEHLRAKNVSITHYPNVNRQLEALIEDCKFKRLSDLNRISDGATTRRT